MLLASKRRRSVLRVPFFMLGWTAALSALAVYRWHAVLYALLPLVAMTTIGELRWVRRIGPFLETWAPELWAPLRRGQMNAQDAQVLVRIPFGRRRGHDLLVGAPGAPAEQCTRFATYLKKPRALDVAARVGEVLGVTVRDETESEVQGRER